MGSVFSIKAIESGFSEIKILDNFSYAADPSRLGDSIDDIEIIRGDIRDLELVVKESKNFDYVVNFAAETHNDNSIERPTDFFEVNAGGVLSILEAARENGFHFHQISTDEVFGDLPLDSNLVFDEDSKFAPSSPYSASKASADLLVGAWVRTYGVSATISHSANNYGENQHQEKLIPSSIAKARRGEPITLYGSGLNQRDWLQVSDHAEGILRILRKAEFFSGSSFFLSAKDVHSNLEIADAINKALGVPPDNIQYVTDRPGHDKKYSLNPDKSQKLLGWTPVQSCVLEWLSEFAN